MYITQDMSSEEISASEGVSISSVHRALKKYGIKKPPKRWKISKDRLYDMYITNNLNAQQIADIDGVSLAIVSKRLNHYEISEYNGDDVACVWDVFDEEFRREKEFERKLKRRSA